MRQIFWTESGIDFATAEARRLEDQIRRLQDQHHSCRNGNSCTHDVSIDLSSIHLEIAMLTNRLGERRLQLALVATAPKLKGCEFAQVGHIVIIRRYDENNVASQTTQTFLLGGWEEISDPEAKIQTISCNSPLGKVLIGKTIGEISEVEAPGGFQEVELLGIEIPNIKQLTERRSVAA